MSTRIQAVYDPLQRWVALAYGLLTHAVFLTSVVVMFYTLYHGLAFGLVHLHGWIALVVDVLLIAQFAAGHSVLLSDRGRRLMTRLAPLGLGRDLSTTIFAMIASLQLLATFLLWSPSNVLWAAPEGPLKTTLTVLYAGSWLLLAKSMSDAGLGIQVGILGWYSVWKGKPPAYRPFSRTGMFRYSRQPIYLSFTLILWTAPTWTLDHLLIAVGWSAYCLLAPVLKERRYQRWYGEAFQRYRALVPYWIPGRHKRVLQTSAGQAGEHEVIIVGAGPVGLLLACLLGQRGMRVLVLERRSEPITHSQAIGITPPSLEILAKLELDTAFIANGVRIRDCRVHGEAGALGCATFRSIPGRYPYILSLPQHLSLRLLEAAIARHPSVTVRRGAEVVGLAQNAKQITITTGDGANHTAAFAVACDGAHSRVRELLQIRTRSRDYGCHFVMGDFVDRTGLRDDGHLFFTADGAVESFPLPGRRRRWIIQTERRLDQTIDNFLCEVVARRTGHRLAKADQFNQSAFSPRRLDCEILYDGRALLCGDAAHVMSPIGGQGMNTGFADAEFAAEMLHAVLRGGQRPEPWLAAYDRCRRKAAATAANRAALGMTLGIWRGPWRSVIRDYVLRHLLQSATWSAHVGSWFAMLSIPCNRVFKSRWVLQQLNPADLTHKQEPVS